ncbi:MAG: hypothetical protein IKK72_00330 [Oscillospiraceae bacterium]|nr:hypothetical protein [Oscillospiraceae bacterium]
MAKQELTFTFQDPNAPGVLEKQLQKILIDKLLYLAEQNLKTGAHCK